MRRVPIYHVHPVGGSMRKIAVLLVAAAALGVAAQSASADVPNPDYQVINYGPVKDFTCRTGPLYGVSGQYGAWGTSSTAARSGWPARRRTSTPPASSTRSRRSP